MVTSTKPPGQHRSNACEACKKRRSRCRGSSPCEKCSEIGTECVFLPQYDKRRRSAVQTVRKEVNTLHKLLEEVVEAAEADDKQRIEQLTLRMRNYLDASTRENNNRQDPLPSPVSPMLVQRNEEDYVKVPRMAWSQLQRQHRKLLTIYKALQTCDLESLPSIIGSIREAPDTCYASLLDAELLHPSKPGITLERQRRSLYSTSTEDVGILHDEPLYPVSSVRSWTTIVSDEEAAHLFSIYFTWEIWYIVEPDLFIRDLNAGAREFCSPLLVNAVLCCACNFSCDVTKPWGRREEIKMANKLLAEVERLWPIEKKKVCLTTVQSSLIIGVLFCASGKDKVGATYVEYGTRMAERMGLHTSSPTIPKSSRHAEADIIRAFKVIAWAVFELQGIVAQLCRTKPVWERPPEISLNERETREADKDRLWTPYPFESPAYKQYKYTQIAASEEQHTISNEIAAFALTLPDGPLSQEHWVAGAELYNRLVASNACLPPVLQLRWNKTPRNICSHLHYYGTIVNLCELFDSHPLDVSCVDPTKEYPLFDPHQHLLDAMDAMASLILLYRACHGWDYVSCIIEHYLCLVGIHAATKVHINGPWLDILSTCISGLWQMSRSWRLARPLLRAIAYVLKSSPDTSSLLPVEVLKILQQFEGEVWSKEEIASLSANYVVHRVPEYLASADRHVRRSRAEGIENLILMLERTNLSQATCQRQVVTPEEALP